MGRRIRPVARIARQQGPRPSQPRLQHVDGRRRYQGWTGGRRHRRDRPSRGRQAVPLPRHPHHHAEPARPESGRVELSASRAQRTADGSARHGDLRDRVMRVARPPVVVSLAAVFCSLPVILYGFPVLGHDGPMHRLRCREFASQFWSGEWYPRWLMAPHHGVGSPAFFVYGPVPYYITSLIAPLGRWFGKPPGYLELSLAAVLALWGSGLAAYLWLRRICGETTNRRL